LPSTRNRTSRFKTIKYIINKRKTSKSCWFWN